MQGPRCTVIEFALEQRSRSKGEHVNGWAWEWLCLGALCAGVACAARTRGLRKLKFRIFF